MRILHNQTRNQLELKDVAGSVFATYIADQRERATAVNVSLEQRAMAVITSSGALVTLVLALAALTNAVKKLGGGTNATPLPELTRWIVVAALAAFVMAVFFALLINGPRSYGGVKPETLLQMTGEEAWAHPDPIKAGRLVAKQQPDLFERFVKLNKRKATYLWIALIFELVAVLGLAAAVASLLLLG